MSNRFAAWLNVGLDPELYRRHSEAIYGTNRRLARMVSFVSALLGVFLFASSFGVTTVSGVRGLYAALTLAMVVITLLCRQPFAKKGRWGTLLFYILMFCVYLFGALLGGAIQAHVNAVMFCVFLVVLPQTVVDYPWRAALPGIAMEVLFLTLAAKNCPANIFNINLLNSFSSLVLGMVLGRSAAAAKAKEFRLLDTVRGQRDTDALTSLTTRRAAEEQITQLLEYENVPCALMLIDVDNFKSVNDTYGHDGGDKALALVAAALRRCFRSTDLVCRLGGDEFLVLAPGIAQAEGASLKGQEILTTLAASDPLLGTDFHPTLSIGIAMCPRDGSDFNSLYRCADEAMYAAKRGGKNSFALYTPGA